MLTEEDKNRIRLEEIYRQELRQQLKPNSSRRERTLAFLNSAFFLWFLSTVLIGTVSFLYTRWDIRREDERRKYEQKRQVESEKTTAAGKLDTEIASRLRFVNGLIETENSFPQQSTLVKSVLILEKPSAMEYPVNVFPEYSNRSFQSLLWELMQVVPSDQKGQIETAFKEAKKLTALFILQTGTVASKPARQVTVKGKSKNILESNESILKEDQARLLGISGLKAFNLERWGKPLVSIVDK
jgi:hypothetical protein